LSLFGGEQKLPPFLCFPLNAMSSCCSQHRGWSFKSSSDYLTQTSTENFKTFYV